MKKIGMILSSVLAASISFNVFAEITVGASPGTVPAGAMTGSPCKIIEDACKSAGYAKGAASEGKGLFKDCMKPVMDGRSVSGVNVSPEAVQACKSVMGMQHPPQEGPMRQGPPQQGTMQQNPQQ